jgi:hypothetical protein
VFSLYVNLLIPTQMETKVWSLEPSTHVSLHVVRAPGGTQATE